MNNSPSTRKPGFSLVELLVYMAIIAVLISMIFVGINIVQRSSRDEERKIVVEQIRSAIDLYFRTNAAYPVETTSLIWAADHVTVGAQTVSLPGFKGYSSTATDATRTRYVYLKDRSGYIMCVKMEAGSWFRSGTGADSLQCPTN